MYSKYEKIFQNDKTDINKIETNYLGRLVSKGNYDYPKTAPTTPALKPNILLKKAKKNKTHIPPESLINISTLK